MVQVLGENGWRITNDDGETLAFKIYNHEASVVHKEEALVEIDKAIEDYKIRMIKHLTRLTQIKFKLLELNE